MGRIDGIQWLRALAALAVVLDHAGVVIGSHANTRGPYAMATEPLKAGVDLFFVISGFVIALPIFAGRTPERGKFLFARLVRIYPMAILTSALYMALVGKNYPDPPVPGFLASALLLPSSYANIPAVIWTLKQEMLFYVLFLAVLSDRKTGFALISVWCLTSFAYVLLARAEAGAVWAWLFHVKNVEFGIGIVACMVFWRMQAGRTMALVLACAGGLMFGCAAYLLPDSRAAAKTLVLGGSAATMVYAIACMRLPHSRVLLFLGSASYSIYLINLLSIAIVSELFAATGMPNLLAFGLGALSGVAAGILYHLVFERPLENWRKARQVQWFTGSGLRKANAAA